MLLSVHYYVFFTVCRCSIIRIMFSGASLSVFPLSSLHRFSYGMFILWGIALHSDSVKICFWSSKWDLQDINDMFP